MSEKRCYTVQELQEILGVSRPTIYNLLKKMMLSRLVDTFFSRTSWTMLLYAENHSISVA